MTETPPEDKPLPDNDPETPEDITLSDNDPETSEDITMARTAEETFKYYTAANNYIKNAPTFNQTEVTFEDFTYKVIAYITANPIFKDDNTTIKALLYNSCQGSAFSLIKQLQPNVPPQDTLDWKDYLKLLGSYFEPQSEHSIWKERFLARIQERTEGIIPYLTAKWALFGKLHPENAHLFFEDFYESALQGMINKTVAYNINMQRPGDFPQLLEKAQIFVANEARAIRLKLTDSHNTEGLTHSSFIPKYTSMSGEPMDVNEVIPRCWSCQKEGHYKRDCRNRGRGRRFTNTDGRNTNNEYVVSREDRRNGTTEQGRGANTNRGRSFYRGNRYGARNYNTRDTVNAMNQNQDQEGQAYIDDTEEMRPEITETTATVHYISLNQNF